MRKLSNKNILITGGLGFIGINFINYIFKKKYKNLKLFNVDCVTNISNKNYKINSKIDLKYIFLKKDISVKKEIQEIFNKYKIDIIINFAAESHVDNSIKNSSRFIKSNIIGTYNLLEAAYKQWMIKPFVYKDKFKNSIFLQISTDEVYGSIKNNIFVNENGKFFPSSPYSASKASAENLVYSYFKTYGLNTLISNSSNNYGPFQNEEKFIPKTIKSIIKNEKILLYGNGKNIRDWIYVEDNCKALINILESGKFGENYNVSSNFQLTNIDLIKEIAKKISKKINKREKSILSSIRKINDRPGHDFRYGISSSKLKKLGWSSKTSFNEGLNKTINWYVKKYEKNK